MRLDFLSCFFAVFLTERALFSNGPNHYITKDQFNWLGTIFYLFFLAFEWPQNLAMQYLPVGKWMR